MLRCGVRSGGRGYGVRAGAEVRCEGWGVVRCEGWEAVRDKPLFGKL